MDVFVALAAGETPRRATIVGDGSTLDGIATGLNMMADEIAERRDREREYQRRLMQAERLAAVGQLAAGVAHEINNPAAFMLSNLTVAQQHADRLAAGLAAIREAAAPHPAAASAVEAALAREELDQVVTDLAQLSADNVEGIRRIASIARTLLGFSRVAPDRISGTRLDRVAEDACRVVEAEIAHRARLVKRLAPVPTVAADHGKLVQVATNLLLNAARAIPEGDVAANEVEITTWAEGERVGLCVRDTGCGIPADLQPRIFEPFFTTRPRGVGTGLGLPVSAEIARLHGGEIRFTSQAGRGSVFELVLPCRTGLTPQVSLTPEPSSAAQGRPRVLVVDDEPALLAAYRRTLGRDYDLTVARSGEEALALIHRAPAWDAILCDLVMPGLDGEGFLARVRAAHPELVERIAFCSGGAFTERTMRFADGLGAELLHKPLEREQVDRVLQRLAAKRRDR
jgi:signal transduction histidine kinase/CheY-like chemotaxis protein